MSFAPFGRAAFAGALCLFAFSAAAESLTLKAAIGRTLQSHPSLRAEAARVDASRQQALLDGLAPPLTLGAELENIAGTGAVSGVRGVEATLRLSHVIELGGKREARKLRGIADVALRENALDVQRLDLAAETTRRFIAVIVAQAELDLSTQQVALAAETQTAVNRRVERGLGATSDSALAEIDIARADIALEHAEHELASAQFALASLWGQATPLAIEAQGSLLELPALPAFEALAQRLSATPDLAQYALEGGRLEAEHTLARARARPDLSLSAGIRRLEALDDQALVFSLSMPFGAGERSALAVARTESERMAVNERGQAALLEARQRLFARFQELRHARTEVEALSLRMIPAAERAMALIRAGYEEARYSLLELTQVQRTRLQLHQERLTAASRYHTLLADIERTTATLGATP